MGRRRGAPPGAALAACAALLPWPPATGQGVVRNPVARHTACPVQANTPTVCTLFGHEDEGLPLEFRIFSLPEVGLLYETSGNFRKYGSDPKHQPDPIGPHLLPFLVTDPLRRVVYVPPANEWAPEGKWASFKYVAQVNVTALDDEPATPPPMSEPGLVVLSNHEGCIAGTNFNTASNGDGWTISGNLKDADSVNGGLKHQSFTWGGLSHYVYGIDEVQYLDFASGLDRSKWYFEASAAGFHGTALTSAYGGKLRFTVRSMYGNFRELNKPLDWVTIECASCDSGRGARMVRFVDDFLRWDGRESIVELLLMPQGLWMRDPLNSAVDFAFASDCEIAAILSNVSRVAILGDFTRAGEGVALDDVVIYQPDSSAMPAYPVKCQKGCPCRHNPDLFRPSCC